MEIEGFVSFIMKYARWAPLIPLLIALARISRIVPAQKWLFGTISLALLTEIIAAVLAKQFGNNLIAYNLYSICELVLLLVIFAKAYDNLIPPKTLSIGIGIILLLAVLNFSLFQRLYEHGTIFRTFESVVVLVVALRYYFLLLKELRIRQIEKTFAFWFSTATLFYFSANLLLFIYSNYIMAEDHTTFMQIWTMHGLLNILLYCLYATALWCKR